jgi:hypothetical protein
LSVGWGLGVGVSKREEGLRTFQFADYLRADFEMPNWEEIAEYRFNLGLAMKGEMKKPREIEALQKARCRGRFFRPRHLCALAWRFGR